MTPIPDVHRRSGAEPARAPRRAAAAACLCFGLSSFFGVGGAALAQERSEPSPPRQVGSLQSATGSSRPPNARAT